MTTILTSSDAFAALRRDLRANPRDPKAWIIMTGFRLCQAVMRDLRKPRVGSWPLVAAYRLLTEFVLGVELRPTTAVGPGLAIHHGTGLVVNPLAVIGEDVRLRNGVVIGNKGPKTGCPVIGDRVQIGANAVVIGEITVGHGAVIGAGAVVTKDVPAGATVVGNPASILPTKPAA